MSTGLSKAWFPFDTTVNSPAHKKKSPRVHAVHNMVASWTDGDLDHTMNNWCKMSIVIGNWAGRTHVACCLAVPRRT